jgi:hypothetical protein
MRWLILLVRTSGMLLVVSAVLKLVDFATVAKAFVHYGLPGAMGTPAVFVLCARELAVGLWAVLKPRAASPAVMLLFTVFTGWHAAMGILADDGDCPCMGISLFGKEGPQLALAPVLAAIAVAAFVLAAGSRRRPDNPAAPRPRLAPESSRPPVSQD